MSALDHHSISGEMNTMPIPVFWSRFLMVVAIGKGAIAGAGLVLAALGAFDIASAITAQQWLTEVRPHFLEVATFGGGVVGAVSSAIFNR